MKKMACFFYSDKTLFICLSPRPGTLCVTNHFNLLVPQWREPAWEFHRLWLSPWQGGWRLSGPCAVFLLQAVSAHGGGGGVYIKEDRFGGPQEEMDQQHGPSLQDPPGAAQMASVHFISTQLFQQACFRHPERDNSCLVRPSWWW